MLKHALPFLLAITPLLSEERDQYPSSEPVTIPVYPRPKEDRATRFRKYVNGNCPEIRYLCKDSR